MSLRPAHEISNKTYLVCAVLIILMVGFNCFFRLNETRVEEWDEARRGVAAYEMLQQNEYLVHTYRNVVDYWSLKPPLGYWFIAGSFSLFEPSIFALRFPSAMAVVMCVMVVMILLFIKHQKCSSLMAGFILGTTLPFIYVHSGRTGDFDAQLALFIALAVLAHEIIENRTLKYGMIGVLIACSFLLKGLSVIYIVAIFSIYFLTNLNSHQKRISLFHLCVIGMAAFLPILIYGYLRYCKDGWTFFRYMIKADLIERPIGAVEGHVYGYTFYLEYLWHYHWNWVVFFLVILMLVRRRLTLNTITSHGIYVVWVAIPLVGATFFQSKLPWYINPIYPGLAILMAVTFTKFFNSFRTQKASVIFLVIFFGVGLIAEARIIGKTLRENRESNQTILLDMPLRDLEGKRLHAVEWAQSTVFVAVVLRHMICVDSQGLEQFLRSAGEDDLFLVREENLSLERFPEGRKNWHSSKFCWLLNDCLVGLKAHLCPSPSYPGSSTRYPKDGRSGKVAWGREH